MIGAGIGVGVVGLGGMGHHHARNVRELGADVVAGADISADARERFADEFDAEGYDSHETLVADERVDAVIVTTPNRFHEPITVAALEADLDVLVEKPLAHTLESAERIAAAAAESTANVMVGFHNRHAASMLLFEEQKSRGRFGDLTHVEANYVRRRGVPGTGSWFTNPELAGGGALIDIGVHALDLALYAMDFPDVVEVSGVTRSTFGDSEDYADPEGFGDAWAGVDEPYEVDDSVTAFVRCAGGETIVLDAAWATNRDPCMDFVVRGTDAGARFEIGDTDVSILETGTAGVDHFANVDLSGDSTMTGHREQDERFLECVATETAPETNTVEEALVVQRVIDAIYESSETNRAVSVESEPTSVTNGDELAGAPRIQRR
ncbi:Gfo/Idh/MocA family protein [Halovivax sp.]|uniref:Gfo/Idh/MocA family protein n=1 Tax=Halovivax sp. TaxID=1935978 RepID=UPI0025C2AFAC|nr:Gfo/Idh/MocA family oxidoreductase [Halovivax sp.]